MKVLLVDDSVATVESMKAVLEQSSAASIVHTADNATGALLQLTQRPEINLLITDFYLPDCTGLDLCCKVRQLGAKLPILIITAADEDMVTRIRKNAEPLGNVMVFRKPLDPMTLIYLLKAMKGSKSDSKRT